MVRVVAEGDLSESDEDVDEPIAVGPQSPLAALRGKRAEMDKKLFLDLAVPRWDEILGRRLWVRYKPGDPAVLNGAVEKYQAAHAKAQKDGKRGDSEWLTRANAEFLVAACVAVYDLPIDEEPPEGPFDGLTEYPTFGSEDLSEAVGAQPNAIATARKVYATDGDLMVAASQLLEWSGQSTPKAEADFLS